MRGVVWAKSQTQRSYSVFIRRSVRTLERRSSCANFASDSATRSMRTTRSVGCLEKSSVASVNQRHSQFLSTYVGRPPRIVHRHFTLQQPTELSDDQICTPGIEYSRDSGNPSTTESGRRKLHRCSWRRIWSQHALIRESILEIALGTNLNSLDNLIMYALSVHEPFYAVAEMGVTQ